ncbi:MAG: O-antigen ligase family protein [Egibacteraceae bacterium]
MEVPRDSPTTAPDPLRLVAPVLLALIGLGFGASAFAEGYYDVTIWGPIAIGLMSLLLALAVWAPARLRGPAAVALGALTLFWLWSLLSASWAESDEQSQLATGRWALYATAFGVLLLLLRDARNRVWALGLAAAGALAVALYVAGSMLLGDGGDLFSGGRLRNPLGYANGQAGYFLVGFWPLLAVAERARNPLLAALGMTGAVLIACLLVVGQTRGILPAAAVSCAAILAVVPGRGRRLWALLAVGGALAIVAPTLLDVYSEAPTQRGAPLPDELAEPAARAMLLVSLALGVLWGGTRYLISGPLRRAVEGRPSASALLSRLATGAAVAIALLALIGAAVAVDDPGGQVKRQYDEFVNLEVETGSDSRFLSGGGYRYDYWRVAWGQFKDNPLKGVGAGSYDSTYFRERRTNEDIRQPHSLELQTLAELGLVGAAALTAFILAVLTGLALQARRARADEWERLLAVAAGGAFIAWLAHTSVDWLHVIPGVTGIALVAAATLVAPWVGPLHAPARGRTRVAAAVAVAVAVLLAAHTVARTTETEFLLADSREALSSDPVAALERAREASALNGDSLRALYAASAAYARLDRYEMARAKLLEAARLEPHEHVPWALLGDLAARRGELRRAKRYYTRALRLNPNGFMLESLAKDPRIAMPSARER